MFLARLCPALLTVLDLAIVKSGAMPGGKGGGIGGFLAGYCTLTLCGKSHSQWKHQSLCLKVFSVNIGLPVTHPNLPPFPAQIASALANMTGSWQIGRYLAGLRRQVLTNATRLGEDELEEGHDGLICD